MLCESCGQSGEISERCQIGLRNAFRFSDMRLNSLTKYRKKYCFLVEKLTAQSNSLKSQSHLTIRPVTESLRPVFCSQSPSGRAKWSAIEKTIVDSKIDRQQSQVIGIGRKWFCKPLVLQTVSWLQNHLRLLQCASSFWLSTSGCRQVQCNRTIFAACLWVEKTGI